jgi:hypothetical protein
MIDVEKTDYLLFFLAIAMLASALNNAPDSKSGNKYWLLLML